MIVARTGEGVEGSRIQEGTQDTAKATICAVAFYHIFYVSLDSSFWESLFVMYSDITVTVLYVKFLYRMVVPVFM